MPPGRQVTCGARPRYFVTAATPYQQGFIRQDIISTFTRYIPVVEGVYCRIGKWSLRRSAATSFREELARTRPRPVQSLSHTAMNWYSLPACNATVAHSTSPVLSGATRRMVGGGSAERGRAPDSAPRTAAAARCRWLRTCCSQRARCPKPGAVVTTHSAVPARTEAAARRMRLADA